MIQDVLSKFDLFVGVFLVTFLSLKALQKYLRDRKEDKPTVV